MQVNLSSDQQTWRECCSRTLKEELDNALNATSKPYAPLSNLTQIVSTGEVELEALKAHYIQLKSQVFKLHWGCCNIRRYNVVIIASYTVTALFAIALLVTAILSYFQPEDKDLKSAQLGTYTAMTVVTELTNAVNTKLMELEQAELDFDLRVKEIIDETQVLHNTVMALLDYQKNLDSADSEQIVKRLKVCTTWFTRLTETDEDPEELNIDRVQCGLVSMVSPEKEVRAAFDQEVQQLQVGMTAANIRAVSSTNTCFAKDHRLNPLSTSHSEEQAPLISPSPINDAGFQGAFRWEGEEFQSAQRVDDQPAEPSKTETTYAEEDKPPPLYRRMPSTMLFGKGEGAALPADESALSLLQENSLPKEDVLKKFGLNIRVLYCGKQKYPRNNLEIKC